MQTLWHSPATAGGTVTGRSSDRGRSARGGVSVPPSRDADKAPDLRDATRVDAGQGLLPLLSGKASPWWRQPFTVGSLALHAAAVGSLWFATQALKPHQPPRAHPIELVLEQPKPVEVAPPAPPEPPKVEAAKPIPLTAPRKATPVARRPQPRTLPAPAAVAEVVEHTAPVEPLEAEPLATPPSAAPEAGPSAVAPALASGPVSMEGIPTDYVGRVYQLINQHSQYPRSA